MAIAAVRYLRAAHAPAPAVSSAPLATAAPPREEQPGPAGAELRRALGSFCTGVTVIAAIARDGAPVGFACQSFTSLSLDPPLVSFNVARTSASWPRIARSGTFCASVLAADQAELCGAFARSSATAEGADKFAGVPWFPAPATGSPRLDGALAWVDCTIQAVHVGGDHLIVLGRVRDLAADESPDAEPLLFYRGGFSRLRP